MLKMNIIIKIFLILALFQSLFLNANAFNTNDHRIAVLVNDQIITSYDVVQRMKLSAILSGIEITESNNNQILNIIEKWSFTKKLNFKSPIWTLINISEAN